MGVGYLRQFGDAQRIQKEIIEQGDASKLSRQGHCAKWLEKHIDDESTKGEEDYLQGHDFRQRINQPIVHMLVMSLSTGQKQLRPRL